MTKDAVLSLLRAQSGAISGQKIAETLKISRTAVWKAVDALRRDGYQIDSQPRIGYRLACVTPKLSLQEIQNHLADHPWREDLIVMDTVDSTNNLAKQLAASGAPEGTAVLADMRQKGRGRHGREFSSPAGMGIYLSVVLRPDAKPEALMHLTAAAAEAVAEALEECTGLHAQIKWVNDLVAGGKKLSGILTELSVELESGRVQYLVIGVGVNCAQSAADFPPELAEIATSIAVQTGVCPDRNALAAAMLRAFSRLSQTLFSEQSAWMARYAARCLTIGAQVQVLGTGEPKEAVAIGIDKNAALEVEYPDGTHALLNSGEVSVRGLYGYL